MVSAMVVINYKEDVAYFLGLPFWKFDSELQTSTAKYLRGLATHLNLPTRYDCGSIKSGAVLAAAIYEEVRRMKQARV